MSDELNGQPDDNHDQYSREKKLNGGDFVKK